jgi:hypothetical protein
MMIPIISSKETISEQADREGKTFDEVAKERMHQSIPAAIIMIIITVYVGLLIK